MDNLNVAQMVQFFSDREENIVGKGENAPAFSPFPTIFSKVFYFQGCLKSGLCGKGLREPSKPV